jgi:hypothetical protein
VKKQTKGFNKMNIQEILQIMSDNAKPDENGDIFKSGHVMHNIHFDGAPILAVGEHIMRTVLYQPNRYTLAPLTHEVNNFTVPAPIDFKPIINVVYYTAAPASRNLMGCVAWTGSEYCLLMLTRKVLFSTKEAAQQNALAWLGLDPDLGVEDL